MLLAAVVVGVQLAIGWVWQSQREVALQRELGALRHEGRRLEVRLGRELRSAQAQAQRMRASLARNRAIVSTLRNELARTRASHTEIRRRLDESSETLQSEPPPLGLRVAPIDPLSGLLVLADNAGRDAIRIAESQGRLWIGARAELLPAGEPDLRVEPGQEVDVFDFPLSAWETGPVARGDVTLRGAICLVYLRERDSVSTEWAREIWFEYRPPTGGTALLRQERWTPWPGEVACDLAAATPPW